MFTKGMRVERKNSTLAAGNPGTVEPGEMGTVQGIEAATTKWGQKVDAVRVLWDNPRRSNITWPPENLIPLDDERPAS